MTDQAPGPVPASASKRARRVRALYQGWLGYGNLGDEALLDACVRSMPRVRWEALPFDEPPPRRLGSTGLSNTLKRHFAAAAGWRAMLGGGTIINRTEHWLEQYRLLRRTSRRAVPVFSPGVADPAFWSAVPGWKDTRAAWRDELADLPEVGVRGPQSKRLLHEAGVRNVVVAGDPCIAFYRGKRDAQAPGRRSVGLNAGTATGLLWGGEERAQALLAEAARRLDRAGFDVRVFPVWQGDEAACRAVARAGGVPDGAVDSVPRDAGEFIRYLDRFDVIVSFKLHAAVFAAAAVVPFVAIEYQPKVGDFTGSIGWDALTFRSDTVDASTIEGAVRTVMDDIVVYRDRLDSRVADLARTFRAYARRVEELLLS